MMYELTNMRDTGFLSYGEYKDIELITGEGKFSTIFTDLSTSAVFLLNHKIAIAGFGGRYAHAGKGADAALRPENLDVPTIVVEVGYIQSLPSLHMDMDHWLRGGSPTVAMVIQSNFLVREPARVACQLMVHRLDPVTQEPALTATHVRDNL